MKNSKETSKTKTGITKEIRFLNACRDGKIEKVKELLNAGRKMELNEIHLNDLPYDYQSLLDRALVMALTFDEDGIVDYLLTLDNIDFSKLRYCYRFAKYQEKKDIVTKILCGGFDNSNEKEELRQFNSSKNIVINKKDSDLKYGGIKRKHIPEGTTHVEGMCRKCRTDIDANTDGLCSGCEELLGEDNASEWIQPDTEKELRSYLRETRKQYDSYPYLLFYVPKDCKLDLDNWSTDGGCGYEELRESFHNPLFKK